jgi:hypothetical protein
MSKPFYVDVADQDEDRRIEIIGNTAMKERKTVAFVTDDEADKADRYVRKLQARFPGIVVIDRFRGPVAHTVSVKVGPPSEPFVCEKCNSTKIHSRLRGYRCPACD